MSKIEYITAEQAIEAIERCAFPDGDRAIVHGFSGGIGCDWSVEAASDTVRNAWTEDGVPQIAWDNSMFGGRCLHVVERIDARGGRLRVFDTVVPA